MNFANFSRTIFFQFFSFSSLFLWNINLVAPHITHYASPSLAFEYIRYRPMVSVRFGIFRSLPRDWIRQREWQEASNLINIPSMFDSCLLDGRSRFTQIPHSSEHITRRHNWKQIKMSKRMGWLTSERAAPNVQILKGHRHCHQTFSAYVLTWHERENWCEYERAQKPDKENTCEFNSFLLHYCAIHVNFFGNNRLKKKTYRKTFTAENWSDEQQAKAAINVNQR